MKAAILPGVLLAGALSLSTVHAQFTAAGVTETISTADSVNQSQQSPVAQRLQQRVQGQQGQQGAVPGQPNAEPPGYDRNFAAIYGESAARNQARAMRQPQAVVVQPGAVQPGTPGIPGAAGQPLAIPVRAPKKADPDREQRIIEFQKQNAISGNRSAQYDLGMRYLKGDGVEQDDALALQWLKNAAQAGHSRAEKELPALEKRIAENAAKVMKDPGPNAPVKTPAAE